MLRKDVVCSAGVITRGGESSIGSIEQTVTTGVTLTLSVSELDRNMTEHFTNGLCAALEAGDKGGCFGVGCFVFGECMATRDYPSLTRESCTNGGSWYDTTNVSDCATISSISVSERLGGTRRRSLQLYEV